MTAERIRVIVQQFYNHAIRNLLVTTNPAQPLRGAITRAPVQHHRHLSEKELGAFWRKLGEQGAHVTNIAATKLLMLTMTRKSELLRSKWHEFDLDAAQWDLPAERMKMGKPHRVFLSRQAVEILRQASTASAAMSSSCCSRTARRTRRWRPTATWSWRRSGRGRCSSWPTGSKR